MGIFDKKKQESKPIPKTLKEEKVESVINKIDRPKICTFDLGIINEGLKTEGYNIYKGSIGKKVKVPNYKDYQNHQLLLNFDFPSNIHEYDVFILDLDNAETIDYEPNDNIRQEITGSSYLALLSRYPETLFDPRPLSSFLLNGRLRKISNRRCLMIVFATNDYASEYEPIEISSSHNRAKSIEKYDIYSFFENRIPTESSLFGKEMKVVSMRSDLQNLLEKHIPDSFYNQTFHHPTVWENNERVNDKKYFPLILNQNEDIISYYNHSDNFDLFVFPQFKDKKKFVLEFLKSIAPSISPELFPYSTQNSWKDNKEYRLPNEQELLDEKEQIIKEYNTKIKGVEKRIDKNKKDFAFLHDILSESGDELVGSVIQYLKWLGFKNVIDVDSENPDSRIKEEDIQVTLDEELLIIEVKGIGGTSTDSECSQISKIKHRRCKERNAFDVYALYLVNHQRYLPPLKRSNPPFTKEQLNDAINDERGLLTTWQLYNLYYDVQNGVITKAEARKRFIDFGLVEFKPNDLVLVDDPKEFFKNNQVCIVNIKSVELYVGEELIVEKNGKYEKNKILSLKVDDNAVEKVSHGEIGIEFSNPITKKSRLWKKNSST